MDSVAVIMDSLLDHGLNLCLQLLEHHNSPFLAVIMNEPALVLGQAMLGKCERKEAAESLPDVLVLLQFFCVLIVRILCRRQMELWLVEHCFAPANAAPEGHVTVAILRIVQ